MSQASHRLARDLAVHAAWLADTGVADLPRTGIAPYASRGAVPEVAVPAAVPSPSTDERATAYAADLNALRAVIGDCTRCGLAAGRKQIVFGAGNAQARIVFVGEGPGYEEDQQGIPFVGKAGSLLTDMIEKGMRLRRADVYICNVVKCRPPGNRNPEPGEVAACSPFLARQVELVAPEVIVALGKFAAQTLLQSEVPISRLRGRWHEFRGIPLMPTFHPAHLLRNPEFKRDAWEDLKQVMQRLGLKR